MTLRKAPLIGSFLFGFGLNELKPEGMADEKHRDKLIFAKIEMKVILIRGSNLNGNHQSIH
jgi:hypothetical protein